MSGLWELSTRHLKLIAYLWLFSSDRDIVAEVAKDHADAEIKFAIGDADELADELSSLGLGQSEEDVRVACLAEGGRKYVMPALQDGEAFSADSLRRFIRDLAGGRVEPVLKSEPVPVKQGSHQAPEKEQ